MKAYSIIPSYDLEAAPETDAPNELWADDDFFDDLIDALNANFVSEVEASRAREDH